MPKADKPTQLARLIREDVRRPIHRLLVVGCGDGREAAILQRELQCEVIGIDLNPGFAPDAAKAVKLQVADATALPFGDGEFDFVYSYHALEHIPDWRKALQEMARVLTPGGYYCVGTPNRTRLVGYVGSGSSLRNKLAWNLADWKMRLKGRFRNEFGAHAGFTSRELSSGILAEMRPSSIREISTPYYCRIYPRQQSVIKALDLTGLGRFAYPSVYFLGAR
jgi:SAM-dependent methyltransferase